MGTVRIERCPECGLMVGEGRMYEHQQERHASNDEIISAYRQAVEINAGSRGRSVITEAKLAIQGATEALHKAIEAHKDQN